MFKAQSLKFRVWGLSFEGYEFDKAMLKSTEVSHRFLPNMSWGLGVYISDCLNLGRAA